MSKDICQLCEAEGPDKRTLLIECFYELTEVVPELETATFGNRKIYRLRICKSCRGRLIGHLAEWRKECVARRNIPKDHDGNDTYEEEFVNIPVRLYGTTVMMTPQQYEEYSRARTG